MFEEWTADTIRELGSFGVIVAMFAWLVVKGFPSFLKSQSDSQERFIVALKEERITFMESLNAIRREDREARDTMASALTDHTASVDRAVEQMKKVCSQGDS